MIEQRLGDCDEATWTAFAVLAHLDAGHSPPDAYDRSMARRWERSQDRSLLRGADRINDHAQGPAQDVHNFRSSVPRVRSQHGH
jgi:hypothetical protein